MIKAVLISAVAPTWVEWATVVVMELQCWSIKEVAADISFEKKQKEKVIVAVELSSLGLIIDHIG